MNNFKNVYETVEEINEIGIQYYFLSQGDKDIIKLIQYMYIKKFNDRNLYNLGGEGIDDQNVIESYQRGKKYNAVFLIRKSLQPYL